MQHEKQKSCNLNSSVQQFVLIAYPSFQHYRQSLHSFGEEHVTLWGNYVACIECTKMSFTLCRRCWNNQQSSCAIRQWRIYLFMLPPSTKWIETVSYNVRRQKLSLIFSNFVQYTVIQWFRSVDASVVDADVTSVPSGAPWNQSNGLTFSFTRIGSGPVVRLLVCTACFWVFA